MKEELLHFLWASGRCPLDFYSADQHFEILSLGIHNMDAGPDFIDCRLKIDGLLWAGCIEIHINSSDWYAHSHESDLAYGNVLLHVVVNNDMAVFSPKTGKEIPVLCIKEYVDLQLLYRYEKLMTNNSLRTCGKLFVDNNSKIPIGWLERMGVERLEIKSNNMFMHFHSTSGDPSSLFIYTLFKAVGFNKNADAFAMLADSIPQKIISKFKFDNLKMQSLLFGQAGFLNMDAKDEFHKKLIGEYAIIKSLYDLKPLDFSLWKYHRMRPDNFPSVRIAQLSILLSQKGMPETVINAKTIKELYAYLDFPIPKYWQSHYDFAKQRSKIGGRLGQSSKDILIINCFVPMMFFYSKLFNDSILVDSAIDILEEIKGENNSIVNLWKDMGVIPKNALQSQALVHISNNYCANKKCMQCSLGKSLLLK